jgi:hypothetical protein
MRKRALELYLLTWHDDFKYNLSQVFVGSAKLNNNGRQFQQ